MNRQSRLLILALFLVTVFLAPNSSLAEEITIVGTGDGVAVLEAVGEAFTAQNPGVKITVPASIGSGGGIKTVGEDTFVLGRVARPIKEREASFGLEYMPFAKVPVTFFVNNSVSVSDLTFDQICDIYSGKITNWKEVGGSSGKIRVVRREDDDSSLLVLRASFPGFKDLKITEKSKTALHTQDCVEAVENKEGTIGFAPLDVLGGKNVKPLSIGGVEPLDSSYPSLTTLALVYKKSNETGNVGSFLSFIKSPAAKSSIKNAGAIPN